MNANRPQPVPVVISMGDPAGIGPEIILKAAALLTRRARALRIAVVGDLAAMRAAAANLVALASVPVIVPQPVSWRPGEPIEPGVLPVIESSKLARRVIIPGRPTIEGAHAAYGYIEAGARMALDGRAAGLVTAPINKQWLNRAGHRFPGHSELLAKIARVRRWRMMFIARDLRLALVTVHIGLARVPQSLTRQGIFDTIDLLASHLRASGGIANPHIAVLGFNPHAGENGLFGREEIDIIAPAIEMARKAGIDAFGPLPPDTAFVRNGRRFSFDAAVAMYHDQGLIPIKTLDFDHAVNLTLGLPFIRTSPDHGTAYDIAGQGKARPQSMLAAISIAATTSRAGVPSAGSGQAPARHSKSSTTA